MFVLPKMSTKSFGFAPPDGLHIQYIGLCNNHACLLTSATSYILSKQCPASTSVAVDSAENDSLLYVVRVSVSISSLQVLAHAARSGFSASPNRSTERERNTLHGSMVSALLPHRMHGQPSGQ